MSEYAKNVQKIDDMWKKRIELPEIVRCRDCKYYESIPEDSGDWCGYWTDRIYSDARGSGYCAWGERREQ